MTKARDLANASTALSAVNATELGYLDGVTSAVQTQIDTKAASSTVSSHTGASTGIHGVTGAVVGTTDTQTLTAKTVKGPNESVTYGAGGYYTAATQVENFANQPSFIYYAGTNTGNWTLNATNLGLAVGESKTITIAVTNGGTAYYQTGFQIDGSSQTIKWSGGTAPSGGNANAIDAYSFTIIKTAATPTYTVFGAGPIKYA